MNRLLIVLPLLLGLLVLRAGATMHQVPGDYATIQAAMDVAADGDTVLVADGTYGECVKFRGHNVVLASEFLLDGDLAHVLATVIDASSAATPDTGSCVLIFNGEDSTAAVIGFTLTGGVGTPLFDPPTGSTYREGGGMLIEESSPRVSWNLIRDNEAISEDGGMTSAGGGGIRSGNGAPLIEHNIFLRNQGEYGAGLVINYGETTARHNLFINNEGGEDYGGVGVWAYGPTHHCVVTNNTIVGNVARYGSNGRYSGVYCWSTSMEFRNNIVWGNLNATGSQQVQSSGGEFTAEYNDIQGGWEGIGNIDSYPGFLADGMLNLAEDSPCVDAGDPSDEWNDPEDPDNPGSPLLPARGTLLGDIGATGGPDAALFMAFVAQGLSLPANPISFGTVLAGSENTRTIVVQSRSTASISIGSAVLQVVTGDGAAVRGEFPWTLAPFMRDTLYIDWSPAEAQSLVGILTIEHDDPVSPSPVSIDVSGTALGTAAPEQPDGSPHGYYLKPNVPNPFNPSTVIEFGLGQAGRADLVVYNDLGQEVAHLANGEFSAGAHKLVFNSDGLASGLYFLALTTTRGREVRPIVKTP